MVKAAVLKGLSIFRRDPENRPARSRAQELFLSTFARGKLNYVLSFASDASVVVLFLGWAVHAWTGNPWLIPLFAASGLAVWGLSEYAFHRWLYHQDEGIFREGHAMHHAAERAPVALPWFVSTAALLALWYAVTQVLRLPALAAFFAGWMTGSVYYSWMHHAMHHWTLRGRWLRRMQARHRIHHRFPGTNYGVTTQVWDRVFGTDFNRASRHDPVAKT